jgi:hypothetical protein
MKTLIPTQPLNKKTRSKARSNYNTVMLTRLDYDRIPGCLGIAWAIEDVATHKVTFLGTKVPFEGDSNKDWQWYSSLDKPVQGKSWKYFGAPKGRKLRFWSIPMCGTPGNLKPRFDLIQRTNTVTCTMQCGKYFKFCPTNGYLSTQWLARQVPTKEGEGGKLEYDFSALIKMINDPTSGIRQQLCGGVPELLMAGIKRAKAEGGHVYLMLYELSDPELLQCILDNAKFVTIILSNTGPDDATNKAAREQLHKAKGLKIIDRMLPADEIGHCKIVIYVDASGKALFILGGSTNWTATGLCCQTNGAIEVDIPEIAQQGLDYHHAVEKDCGMSPMQNTILRELNATAKEEFTVPNEHGGTTRVRMWNSPNMTQRTKPKTDPPTPPDMGEIFGYIQNMKEHAGFLLFMPGTPSILDKLLPLAQSTDKIIRGAVSSAQALPRPGGPKPKADATAGAAETHLIHRAGEPPVVVVASAIQQAFANFLAEILKLPDAHAIIHSKILVIDAFAEDPNDIVVVITSHNLGFKASYQNDETMFIIRGCRELAMAILVQIYDAYDHYRFRYAIEKHGDGADNVSGFLVGKDTWQDPYLSGARLKEMEYLTRSTEVDEYEEPTDADVAALKAAVANPVLEQKNGPAVVVHPEAAKLVTAVTAPPANPVEHTVKPAGKSEAITGTTTDGSTAVSTEARPKETGQPETTHPTRTQVERPKRLGATIRELVRRGISAVRRPR